MNFIDDAIAIGSEHPKQGVIAGHFFVKLDFAHENQPDLIRQPGVFHGQRGVGDFQLRQGGQDGKGFNPSFIRVPVDEFRFHVDGEGRDEEPDVRNQ